MILKCKICGGNLEVEENSRTAICEYCGNEQSLPKIHNESKQKLYERANHFRMNNEYDKATALYENILNEDSEDSEIYWQLVLCEYGVEYVKDKKTDRYLPTCNRTKTISIFANNNYKQAIKYANDEQKNIYEQEAQKIDAIQKNAIEIANNEEPFDIFICYKETDETGNRTKDSVLAQDIYNNLTKQGYKVFFSRITLENKLGTEYEPYIFSALNSSKIMIVIGTQKEFVNSVWVKNEWSRFLSIAKEKTDKVLIPCYKEMDPYDLPEEFAHLQALNLEKIGIITDLQNKISEILRKNSNTQKNKIKPKISKKIIRNVIVLAIIIIIAIIAVSICFAIKSNMSQKKYDTALELMKDGKYTEAVIILKEIEEYKDSKDRILICEGNIKKEELSQYIGIYDKTETFINEFNGEEEPVGYMIEVTKANSNGIEFSMEHYGHRVAGIGALAKEYKDGVYKFTFIDSWQNGGEGIIELLDDGIKVTIEITQYNEMANWSIGSDTIEFKFSDKTT